MLKIFTFIIFVIYILSIVVDFGLAINQQKRTIKPIDYYLEGIESILLAFWLYHIMKVLGYL